jgi:hypothetical protein
MLLTRSELLRGGARRTNCQAVSKGSCKLLSFKDGGFGDGFEGEGEGGRSFVLQNWTVVNLELLVRLLAALFNIGK